MNVYVLISFHSFQLYSVSCSTGLQLNERPTLIQSYSDREEPKIVRELERIAKENRIKILFVVIPDSGPTYSTIKKLAEIRVPNGVLTQCIKAGTVFRKRSDMSTISNSMWSNVEINYFSIRKRNGNYFSIKNSSPLIAIIEKLLKTQFENLKSNNIFQFC